MEKKNIYIFYGSYGNGHKSAANAIKEEIEEKHQNTYNIIYVDALKYIDNLMDGVYIEGYNFLITEFPELWKLMYSAASEGIFSKILEKKFLISKNKLMKMFKEKEPDYIISTHPFTSLICSKLKDEGKIKSNISTILTDYETHKMWYKYNENVDKFFVATEEMKESLVSEGIEESKIYITGIPTKKEFNKVYSQEEIKEIKKEILGEKNIDKKVAVFFGTSCSNKISKEKEFINLIKTFEEQLEDYKFICITGKKDKTYKVFNEMAEKENLKNTKFIKFTKKIPELMAISEFIVSKPGGLTTTECLVSKTPILIVYPIPGQEEANANYLESKNLGKRIDFKNLEELLNEIKNEKLIEKIKENLNRNNLKNTTSTIVEKIFETL